MRGGVLHARSPTPLPPASEDQNGTSRRNTTTQGTRGVLHRVLGVGPVLSPLTPTRTRPRTHRLRNSHLADAHTFLHRTHPLTRSSEPSRQLLTPQVAGGGAGTPNRIPLCHTFCQGWASAPEAVHPQWTVRPWPWFCLRTSPCAPTQTHSCCSTQGKWYGPDGSEYPNAIDGVAQHLATLKVSPAPLDDPPPRSRIPPPAAPTNP